MIPRQHSVHFVNFYQSIFHLSNITFIQLSGFFFIKIIFILMMCSFYDSFDMIGVIVSVLL